MSKYAIEIKWGVLISLLSMLWMFMEKMVGLHSTHIGKHPHYRPNYFSRRCGICAPEEAGC